ncbi:DUF3616 domain-containing protein [Oscillatoria sp. FACHB-1406]|uniref:DUF3616 domain-containing protein n=1 Tax=Oscillatoria sp. FACHB-1406 TaxID=2692846 RepID=UPI0016874F3D|nr:DUF3616 domain-containing protein [Oscillatoria sp. FACHB-1406]MBD2576375.1 DUF3616 domain-containing protein [Oscillatoria sp. FACHB-1406]
MPDSISLSRLRLRFDSKENQVSDELSAVALTPEGNLWLGSDEGLGIERLSPTEADTFGHWRHFPLSPFFPFLDPKTEIDVEGLDYADGYLWVVGSHSTKRKKAKGNNETEDIARLTEIKAEPNRYLLARIPVANGELVESYQNAETSLTAAALQRTETSNILIDALATDPHLGTIVRSGLPSKENGLDIEGLAVRGNRIFLGLRGPVLRGWAVILEIEATTSATGVFTLAPLGTNGELYNKHFLELDGLGVRDLCWRGEDLLVLAGPTMEADGALKVFQLRDIGRGLGSTLSSQDSQRLKLLFNLPVVAGADRAEGLTLYPGAEGTEALMVVYDSPHTTRKPNSGEVFADVFQLT